MKEPITYRTFTEQEKNEFVILKYLGYKIEKQGIEHGWTSGEWFSYNGGGRGVTSNGTEDETYLTIVNDSINRSSTMAKYRTTKSWDKLIPIIEKLRHEYNYTEKYKNQLAKVDYWLNKLNIDLCARYVAGAINVINGKDGAYPI